MYFAQTDFLQNGELKSYAEHFFENSSVWMILNGIKNYKMGNILEILQVPKIQISGIPHFAGFHEIPQFEGLLMS